MKTKISKDIDNVRNGEQLHAWMREAGDQIDRLTADVKSQADYTGITQINKGNWRETEEDARVGEQLGNYIRAVARRDTDTISKMGGRIVRSAPGEGTYKTYPLGKLGDIDEKVGTPWSGDDSSGTGGSYMLPATLYQSMVLRTPFGGGSGVIQMLQNVNMPGRQMQYPAAATEVAFTYQATEVTAKTEHLPTMSYKLLTAETYAGYTGVTDELMDDQIVDIGLLLRQELIEALQVDVIEEQMLNGVGNPATGILSDTGCGTYTIGGTGFGDLTFEDLRETISELPKAKQRRGGVFVMHPTVWGKLCLELDGVGRFYWDPTAGPPLRAWSYGVILSDALPTLSETAADTNFALFGNLKNALHGTRIGLEVKYYDQTYYAVTEDQNFFRWRTRQAFTVGIPANFIRIKTAV